MTLLQTFKNLINVGISIRFSPNLVYLSLNRYITFGETPLGHTPAQKTNYMANITNFLTTRPKKGRS